MRNQAWADMIRSCPLLSWFCFSSLPWRLRLYSLSGGACNRTRSDNGYLSLALTQHTNTALDFVDPYASLALSLLFWTSSGEMDGNEWEIETG